MKSNGCFLSHRKLWEALQVRFLQQGRTSHRLSNLIQNNTASHDQVFKCSSLWGTFLQAPCSLQGGGAHSWRLLTHGTIAALCSKVLTLAVGRRWGALEMPTAHPGLPPSLIRGSFNPDHYYWNVPCLLSLATSGVSFCCCCFVFVVFAFTLCLQRIASRFLLLQGMLIAVKGGRHYVECVHTHPLVGSLSVK